MKNKKRLVIFGIILFLALSLFTVNRYNTNKRREIALDTICTNIIGYVFRGSYEAYDLEFDYTFSFVDENTVNVKSVTKDWQGNRKSAVTQDFDYKIKVKGNEFELNVGEPKNEISTVYKAAKLGVSKGTFMLKDYSYEGKDVYRAVTDIKMSIDGSDFDFLFLDLKTPENGAKKIMLPSDVVLE